MDKIIIITGGANGLGKELLKEAKDNIDNGEPRKLLHKMFEDYIYEFTNIL